MAFNISTFFRKRNNSRKTVLTRLIIIIFLVGLLIPGYSQAQQNSNTSVVITGGDNLINYQAFLQAVIGASTDTEIDILVLPFSTATNALQISPDERSLKLEAAEIIRSDLEEACRQQITQGTDCTVQVIPLLVRADAGDASLLTYFEGEVEGIYILEGEPEIAMQVIGETPIQTALNQLYQAGVTLAGSAPGLFSAALIQEALPASHIDSIFDFGALHVYEAPGERSLDFRLPGVILEPQIFDQHRFGALLRAVTIPGAPQIGIGLDQQSAMQAENQNSLLAETSGAPVLILDAESYHAAQSVRYTGAFQPVGVHNVLAHWLFKGPERYDLESSQHTLSSPIDRIEREAQPLKLPTRAGSLFLSSDLIETPGLNTALTQFINLAGGQRSELLLLAKGYDNQAAVQNIAAILERATGTTIQTMQITSDDTTPVEIPEEITGIMVSAASQAGIDLQTLQSVDQKWRSGIPVWLNHAAVPWAGASFSVPGIQEGTETDFLLSPEEIRPGLNWLPAALQTRIWEENHWGEIFSLAYYQPQNLVLGLPAQTGLEISSQGARVWGEDVLITLDFSQATIETAEAVEALESDEAEASRTPYNVANSLIDIFAPQEMVSFRDADQNAQPVTANTPALPTPTFTQVVIVPTLTATFTITPTPSPVPTETLRIKPSATIKPTQTPPPIPPPPDPARMNFMVAITIIMVVIVLFGIWLNRQWVKNNH